MHSLDLMLQAGKEVIDQCERTLIKQITSVICL